MENMTKVTTLSPADLKPAPPPDPPLYLDILKYFIYFLGAMLVILFILWIFNKAKKSKENTEKTNKFEKFNLISAYITYFLLYISQYVYIIFEPENPWLCEMIPSETFFRRIFGLKAIVLPLIFSLILKFVKNEKVKNIIRFIIYLLLIGISIFMITFFK